MNKKIIALILTLGILCSGFLVPEALAADNVQNIQNRLSEIIQLNLYKPGANTGRWAQGDCWKFANAVSQELFGVSIPSGVAGKYYLTGAASDSNWDTVGSYHGSTASEANITALLKSAKPGDIIQYCCISANPQHTAMIYSIDSNGITIFHQTGSQGVRLEDKSWERFCDWWDEDARIYRDGNFDTSNDKHGITLYRCSKDVLSAGSNTQGTPPVNVSTSSAQSITQNSAVLYGSAKSTNGKMTQCGMMIGTSESNLTKLGSDTINTYSTSMWYSTSKYGYTLQPGTTYYYRAYAVVGGVTYDGNTLSFTTPPAAAPAASISLNKSSLTIKDTACAQLTATTTPSGQAVSWTSSNPSVATVNSSGGVTGWKAGTTTITASMTYGGNTCFASCKVTVTAANSVTYTVSGASNITQSTARVDASCYYTGTRPTTVGLYLGTSQSNLSYYGSDTLVSTATNNPVSVWYNLKNLSAGTTYYYQFYAVANGTTYTSGILSFTTAAGSTTLTGTVTGTGSSYLAINDKPAASPTYSNQIGRIPPGGTVIVYPDKQSGNWYYVSYNGVSGYAYSKYITLN